MDELPDWARAQLGRARVGHLGLIDGDGRPRVLPVTYALCDGALVSAVDHKPKRVPGADLARVRWLRRVPAAALTVDRYDEDWSRLAWVQALGRVDVLDAAPQGALEALAAKYEQYRERPPEGPFLVLAPERFVCWTADR
jgi:PPOX class probable F420-dependent enzyme